MRKAHRSRVLVGHQNVRSIDPGMSGVEKFVDPVASDPDNVPAPQLWHIRALGFIVVDVGGQNLQSAVSFLIRMESDEGETVQL